MTSKYYDKTVPIYPVECFGIVDPDDKDGKKPAELSYDRKNESFWNATVNCGYKDDYMFIPVDNNLSIEGKRCDALIYTNNSICFIELKIQRSDWLVNAILQLESTIADFGKGIKRYKFKRAYVCNKKHPCFNFRFQETMQRFYQKNRVILRTSCLIEKLK